MTSEVLLAMAKERMAMITERREAMKHMRECWRRAGPLDTDMAETILEEDLMLALERFMKADEAFVTAYPDALTS